ncbi:tubby-related protein 4 [Rhopalosiphum padi]|uniref:tubby-related protein 4 n=1 Tax=Rhopalosiphum padi TaxID=40932 RepID=UPI00298E0ADD|nr:tubby-related protein 4 [Rhopalosiphum padi]
MHIRFEKKANTKCDSDILSLSWMGRVPDNAEEEGWNLDGRNYYKQGWLATGNSQGVVGVTFTSIPTNSGPNSERLPLRTNYNLRNHHAKVVLVKWNEPYQKLASCDSSGVINVWAKFDCRWNVELINDRNTKVTYFSWSHDGRLALICYQDGFVLVGSVTGHRYWSSMLHPEGTVTCGAWSPDDQQVYFGTSRGQMKVLDIHGAPVSQVNLSDDSGISSMSWSCEKFCMNENKIKSDHLFKHVLALCCKNGTIQLMRRFDDPAPVLIRTGLCPIHMEWSNAKELLCVAGSRPGRLSTNVVQIYSATGQLVYSINMPQSSAVVTAVTWAHNDRRIFVATGPEIHVACVSASVVPLSVLCALRMCDESLFPSDDVLPISIQNILTAISSSTIYCEVPKLSELRQFVSSSPKNRLYCTVVQHVNGPETTPPVCYVLYMEYLGGLVPLLKGKRISMLRPEFVIFDPQVDDTTYANAQITYNNFGWDDSEPETCSSPKLHRKNRHRSRPACCNRKLQLNCYTDVLPEDYRLAEVTANVWGTEFHIRGLCDDLTQKLGRVSYRTSILHLQPRQMTLSIVGDGQSIEDDSPTPKQLQRRRSCSVGSSNPKIAVSRVVEDSKVSETFAHSLPSSPVAAKKKSGLSSPIRKRLMNSPLFFRKVLRTQIEPDFQNLETFQKSQIKNKIEMCTKRQQFVMQNKAPIWNDLTQVYQLDFGGRVTQESAKNFQVEYDGIQVMQFGRIDRNNFALDFQHPFSAVQAFAVALASVTQRLK